MKFQFDSISDFFAMGAMAFMYGLPMVLLLLQWAY